MEIPGKIRYKNLAHYLSSFASLPSKTFAENYPDGFLVEKTQKSLDKDVIFQFSTKSIEDPDVLEAQKKGICSMYLQDLRMVFVC